jgi:hypothetical protein
MGPRTATTKGTKFGIGFLVGLAGFVILSVSGNWREATMDPSSGGPGWTRLSGDSIGTVAAGGVVLVNADRAKDEGVYRQAAHSLCSNTRHCYVTFWADERLAPEPRSNLLSKAKKVNQTADYVYNAINNFEQYRWDCRIFRRKWEDCLTQSFSHALPLNSTVRAARSATYIAAFPALWSKGESLTALSKMQTNTGYPGFVEGESTPSGTRYVLRLGPIDDKVKAIQLCSQFNPENCLVMIQ